MQPTNTRSLAIGLFILGGMAAAGWLIVKFGEAPAAFTGGTYTVNVDFKAIGLTMAGTEVRLAGKRIGQVDKITFLNPENLSQGVRVVTQIDKQYKLPSSAHAVESTTAAVLGRAVIQIFIRENPSGQTLTTDGSAEIPGELQQPLDALLPPDLMPTMERTVRQIGDLADAMTPVAHELEQLIKNRPLKDVDQPGVQAQLANLSTVIQRFDITLKNVNAILGDQANVSNLKDTLANLHTASKNILEVIDNANRLASELRVTTEDARGGIKDIRGVITKADGMLDGLSATGMDTLEAAGRMCLELEELTRRANEGKGTLGLLANDNRLYESMLLTTERLNKAIDELRGVLEQAKRGDLKLKVF